LSLNSHALLVKVCSLLFPTRFSLRNVFGYLEQYKSSLMSSSVCIYIKILSDTNKLVIYFHVMANNQFFFINHLKKVKKIVISVLKSTI